MVGVDGLKVGVLGLKAHAARLPVQALYSGLVVYHGHNYLPVICRGGALHYDVIAVKDPRVPHTEPHHVQGEQFLTALLGEGHIALYVLYGQYGHTRRNPAQDGHLGGRLRPLDTNGAVEPGVPGDIAQALQGL